MYRSILVPLDGSSFGEHALPSALTLARRAGAALHLVHVHQPPAFPDQMLITAAGVDEQLRREERSYLERLVGRLRGSDVPVQGTLLEGDLLPALEDHVRAAQADLIVMTTHGRGPLSRFWLGSLTDHLVRSAPVPLLLIRPHERPADLNETFALRQILIPLDGSPIAEQALEPARTLAEVMQARCTLVRVIATAPVNEDLAAQTLSGLSHAAFERLKEAHDQARHKALEYLEQAAARLRQRGVHVLCCVAESDQPAAKLLQQIHAQDADLVALATHGRAGVSRLVLGSVADKLVRGAAVPVLIRRAKA